MARIQGVARTEGAQALAAATAETVLQLVAAANHRIALLSLGVSFDGIAGDAVPVLVELVRQSDAGTSSAGTPVKSGRSAGTDETLQTTSRRAVTAEPTTTDVLREFLVHPQTGYERAFGPDEQIEVAGGARLGLRLTAPAVVNARAFMEFEE